MSSKKTIQNDCVTIKKASELLKIFQKNQDVISNLSCRNIDLRNITMDDTTFKNVDFTGANLGGANFSEARFENCIFDEACLIDTCLCESVFENCSFLGSRFGATDICYSEMSGCRFSGHSTLSLNFINLRRLSNCTYTIGNETITFNKAPITLYGLLNNPVAVIGQHMVMGGRSFPLSAFSPSISQFVLRQSMGGECCALQSLTEQTCATE